MRGKGSEFPKALSEGIWKCKVGVAKGDSSGILFQRVVVRGAGGQEGEEN